MAGNLTDEELLLRLFRGEMHQVSIHFNEVISRVREEINGEWISNNELARLTQFSPRTIANWGRSGGKKRTEPCWSDAILALRRLGFAVVLIPQEESLGERLRK